MKEWTALSFREHHADMELLCPRCGYCTVWQPFQIECTFAEKPVPVEEMSRRLRCKRCSGRGAAITALVRGRR